MIGDQPTTDNAVASRFGGAHVPVLQPGQSHHGTERPSAKRFASRLPEKKPLPGFRLLLTLLLLLPLQATARYIELLPEQRQWLDEHPVIWLGVDPDWAPFEFRDEDGQYRGMASNFIALASDRLGVRMEAARIDSWAGVLEAVRRGEVDILPAITPSMEREEYLLFTEPYIDFPMVIITRSNAPFIAGLEELQGMRVSVVDGYFSHEILQRNSPELTLVPVDSVRDGVNAVAVGEVDAFVGNIAAASHAINQLGLSSLKVAAYTPYSYKLSMGVRKDLPELVPILNRALQSITPAEVQMIRKNWVQLRVEEGVNLREVLLVALPITAAILIIFILMGIANRRLHSEIRERQAVEQRLRESEERLLDSQSIAHVGSWVWDLRDDSIIWSREHYAIVGVSPEEYSPTARSFINFIHPEDRHLMKETLGRIDNGESNEYELEFRLVRPSGELCYVKSYGRLERDEHGRPVQLAGVLHDITPQKKVELALREKQQTLQSLLDNAPLGIWFQDKDGRLLFVNQAYCEATGKSEQEFLSMEDYKCIYDSETAEASKTADAVALVSDGPHFSQERMRFADGTMHDLEVIKSRVTDEDGNVIGLIGLSMDVTDRKQAEEKLLHQAYFDELTGLGNRNFLMEQLARSLAQARRHNHYNALLFFDLDNFKIINDSMGHHTGDLLLQDIGRRLQATVREEDTVARLGGDEFVLIANDLGAVQSEAAEQAHTIAEKVRKALAVPYKLGEQEHHITLSVGISMFPTDDNDVNDILKHADTAMYRAKEAGRNAIRFFIPSMQVAAEERLRMQNLLRYAIPRDQLRVYYQPQYNHEGELLGAECLLRWKHPQLGVISPARFIPVAEDSGQIIDIGTWVLRESCKTLKLWQGRGKSDITLSVNVSPRQFHQPGYVRQVIDIIEESGVDPRYLELELTETILIEHIEDVTEKMQKLKSIGVRFAIDDFGTGYSSLAYLKRLPLDRLKIDQSFIREVTNDPSDALIVETIIAMATHLELEVIAEGVETETQLDFLFKRGCAMYQGYFFSRPLTREQFDVYLTHSHSQYKYLK